MPSRKFGRLSGKLMQHAKFQSRNLFYVSFIRVYGECKCNCQKDGGVCNCGPDCKCKHCKKPCPLGPRLLCCRDPPPEYAPECVATTAFQIPKFLDPKIFRPMEQDEKLGPNAGSSECYKNPEFYSYHRYSVYDLRMATNELKASDKFCKNPPLPFSKSDS